MNRAPDLLCIEHVSGLKKKTLPWIRSVSLFLAFLIPEGGYPARSGGYDGYGSSSMHYPGGELRKSHEFNHIKKHWNAATDPALLTFCSEADGHSDLVVVASTMMLLFCLFYCPCGCCFCCCCWFLPFPGFLWKWLKNVVAKMWAIWRTPEEVQAQRYGSFWRKPSQTQLHLKIENIVVKLGVTQSVCSTSQAQET